MLPLSYYNVHNTVYLFPQEWMLGFS